MGGPPPLSPIQPPGWLGEIVARVAEAVGRLVEALTPKWGSGGTGAPGSATNPLTTEQAQRLFEDMASQKHIPFDYPDDGCYARAHEMCRLMSGQGIACEKEWIYASGFPDDASLGVDTPKAPGVAHVDWVYHVAPTVQVQGSDGKPVTMVLDPSIMDKPATPDDWKAKMGDPGAKLEHSDSKPFYRDPGATSDAGQMYDDDYKRTDEVLKKYSEARDNRREAEEGSH